MPILRRRHDTGKKTGEEIAIIAAALQGQGIAMMAEAWVRAMTGLVRIEVDAELPAVPVLLAYHREQRHVPRVRLVLDTLDAALRDALR